MFAVDSRYFKDQGVDVHGFTDFVRSVNGLTWLIPSRMVAGRPFSGSGAAMEADEQRDLWAQSLQGNRL
jgi:hypothetical protein